ncbi:ScbR family autoregulator-binding transcription factor [Streptomyces sp. NPDC050610]|uniref:ScbR family autoregulator-binding transcription factor n=1 Tax=Streptomyces sp. NPDC050610 TaxID=3157097 RepID=UPI0034451C36
MAKQERAVRTRRKVLEAAATVFDEHGYAAANISEILKAAGVTKGALYFHFSSKEELARGVMASQMEETSVPESGSPLQDIIDLTQQLAVRLRMGHDPLLRASIRLTIEHGSFDARDTAPYDWWLETFTRRFILAMGADELRAGTVPEDAAATVVGSFSGIQLLSHVTTDREDITRRITTWWQQLLPGLAAPDALPRLRPEGSAPLPQE